MKNYRSNIVSRVLSIIIALCMVLPVSAILSENVAAETNNNFEIYGTVFMPDHVLPVSGAMVMAVNDITHLNDTTYADENGVYSIFIEANEGDLLIIGATDYFRATKTSFVADGTSKQLDLALEHPTPSTPPPPPNLPEEEEYPEIPPPEPPDVKVTPIPNLRITDISLSKEVLMISEDVVVTATIGNTGLTDLYQAIEIAFYVDFGWVETKTIFFEGFEAQITFDWTAPGQTDLHDLMISADITNIVEESNETDNSLIERVEVNDVESLVTDPIDQIGVTKTEVNEILGVWGSNIIAHLNYVERELNRGLNYHENGKTWKAVKTVNQAVDKAFLVIVEINLLRKIGKLDDDNATLLITKMDSLINDMIDITDGMVNTETSHQVADAEYKIADVMIYGALEMPDNIWWNIIEIKLALALNQYQKAMVNTAKGLNIQWQLEVANAILEEARAELKYYIADEKIPEDLGNMALGMIADVILVFPPDLAVTYRDIGIEGELIVGRSNEITVTVRNIGIVDARNIIIEIYERPEGQGSVLIGAFTIWEISEGEGTSRSILWTPDSARAHYISVVIDPENKIGEGDETNNVAEAGFGVVWDEVTWPTGHTVNTGNTEIYENVTIFMSGGDLTIQPGGKLIFKNNVTLRIESPDVIPMQPLSINLDNSGTFDIRNASTVTAKFLDYPYKIFSHGWLNITNKSVVRWMWGDDSLSANLGGIQIFSDSEVRIENSNITEGYTHNLYVDGGRLDIHDSNITNAGITTGLGHGISAINNAIISINGGRVNNSAENGVLVDNSPSTSITSVDITNNKKDGIHVITSSPDITANNLSANGKYGVYFNGASSSIVTGNLITNQSDGGDSGIYLYDSSPTIEGNEIYENYYGVGTWGTSNPYIANNTISFDHWQGIIIGPNSVPYIYNNTLEYNVYGIDFYDSPLSLLVENNTLNYNQYGMWLSHASPSIVNNTVNNSIDLGIWLYNDNCNALLQNNTISNTPFGNGVYADGISAFTMYYNNVSDSGVGIYLNNGASLDLDNSNISLNTYGLLLLANSTANVTNNYFSSNAGLELQGEFGAVVWYGAGCDIRDSFVNLTNNIFFNPRSISLNNVSGQIKNNLLVIPYTTLPEAVTPAPAVGIHVSNSANVTIEENLLFGGGGWWSADGIHILSTTNISLINNTVASTGIYEYVFRDKTYMLKRLNETLIIEEDGVEIENYTMMGWLEDSMTITDSTVVATGNLFNASKFGLLYINSDVDFRDNSILYHQASGLYVENCTGNITEGNNISSNKNGIYALQTSMTFAGNRIENNTEYGLISIESDNNISDNWVVMNHDGLYYADNQTGLIENNTIGGHLNLYMSSAWDGLTPVLHVKGYGINMFNTSVEVKNNYLVSNGFGMFIEEATPLIESNTIENHTYTISSISGTYSAGYGIYILNNSNPTIRYNNLSSNHYEIYAENTQGIIELNNITQLPGMDVKGYGMEYRSSTLLIQNNDINNHTTGISIRDADASTTIQFNDITDCTFAGITVHNAQGRINDNTIKDCYRGLYLRHEASPHIEYNTITRSSAIHEGYGIYVRDLNSAPTIEYNDISNQERGIVIEWHATPIVIYNDLHDNDYGAYFNRALPDLFRYNDIYGNSLYGAYNEYSTFTINAQQNWWGDVSGPSGVGPGTGDVVSDYIDYSSWSTVANT